MMGKRFLSFIFRRAYYLNVEEMFIQMKGMKGADKDTNKTKPEA
jgi:hypothetical protein